MQASDRVLAGRYAAALFQAAVAKNEAPKVQADLVVAAKLLADKTPILRHPRVSLADKKKLLKDSIGTAVGTVALRFMELLIDKKRYDLFPLVAVRYGRLFAEMSGTAKAVVRTARPLSADAQKALSTRLKTFAGKDIELDVKEDPELIGGLTVKIGDWVLDSSLRGQLRRMRESFYNHGN
ncbi:MAG: ATP synthase F1 subunit delta [Elusimicrobia bacterium RIFOXYD12_FULL_66_9]|nr:MAG: ATP synthase F1 subunit delta [Elusimicrobia bacterium RIFOXYD12_FULL_66_9]